MPKLTSTRSTGKSIGFPSEKQIDMWSSDGRRKASLFAKKQYSTLNSRKSSKASLNNEEDLHYAFNHTINQLREKTQTEKSNSSSISNRMSYLEVDLRRKKQMMEQAKHKYQKMIEVRHRSFVQKRELTQERQSFIRQHHQSVTLKASRIRSERKNSVISAQGIRDKNQAEALKIKNQRILNEQYMKERSMREVEKKRAMVEVSHKYADISKGKVRELQDKRYKQAKQTHNHKMLEQYMKGQMQRHKNAKLISKFKSKVKKIEEESKVVSKELTEYEKMLGWHYHHNKGKKAATSQSFYMTY